MRRFDLTDTESSISVPGIENLARVDELFIASEMTKEGARILADKGVKVFIDLKDPEETGCEDKDLFEGGVVYQNLVFPGIKMVDPEYLNSVNQVLETKPGNICVYCKSGNRVVAWFVLHLICCQGHNKKRVLEWARQFPFYRDSSALELKEKLGL